VNKVRNKVNSLINTHFFSENTFSVTEAYVKGSGYFFLCVFISCIQFSHFFYQIPGEFATSAFLPSKSFVPVATFTHHILGVVFGSTLKKMPFITALWIITFMTRKIAWRNWANNQLKSKSVGTDDATIVVAKCPIAFRTQIALPLPTFVWATLRHFLPKPVYGRTLIGQMPKLVSASPTTSFDCCIVSLERFLTNSANTVNLRHTALPFKCCHTSGGYDPRGGIYIGIYNLIISSLNSDYNYLSCGKAVCGAN
jgi:hypothetical protein